MVDTITLQGTIRDFSPTNRPDLPTRHPDFEADFDPAMPVETGIVGSTLDANHKPVYVGGTGAIKSTHGKTEFEKWYADNHLVQKPFSMTLNKIGTNPDIYRYDNQAFFPIDNELLGNESNPHNYHFTYEVSTEFTYQGGEKFTFIGDDDLWVFIDDKLVIDLGGIHTQQSATATLDDLTWVKYDPSTGLPANEKIKLNVGTNYSLRLFFAERHTVESHFRIDTSIVLTQPVATIIASDPNANELGSDAGEFTLSLDKTALTDLTLKYSVAGTATEGVDYQPIGLNVLLPKGQTSAKITVTPIADQLTEGPETVIVTLIGGSGYQTGTPSSATVTILDNPPVVIPPVVIPPVVIPIVTLTANDGEATKPLPRHAVDDMGEFTISLNQPAPIDLVVNFSIAGTAIEGLDCQPMPRSIAIGRGQSQAKIPVVPLTYTAQRVGAGVTHVIATLQSSSGCQLGAKIADTVVIKLPFPMPVLGP